VIRTISGFHQDEVGDWVAELSCFHSQHVRHRPPFQDRPWVLDRDQRRERIGSPIDCPLCDRAEMPEGLQLTRTGGPWDQDHIPAGLRRSHRTGEGVWGLLEVLQGRVAFRLETTPPLERVLDQGVQQPIPPTAVHEVRTIGPAVVRVQSWTRAGIRSDR
jgi:tellurite resistance-related uncharacterized protein